MTRVDAPCRLHFGLLALPVAGQEDRSDGLPARQFGGVGLMLEVPRVRVQVEPAGVWSAAGPSAERALGFARAFSRKLPEDERRPFAITVQECPQEHVGLGVGTALGLATAKAIAVEFGHAEWKSPELAQRVGRGERSAVGIYGFDLGGLIVEAGKLPRETLGPLIGRYRVPAEWRIVLVNTSVAMWHGARERQAFARVTAGNSTPELCQIVLTGLLPALAAADLPAFGAALHEYNRRAGEGFEAVQGGPWASEEIAKAIELTRSEGIAGAGQSSWGPTVFAIVADEQRAHALKERLAVHLPAPRTAIVISRAAECGAAITSGA